MAKSRVIAPEEKKAAILQVAARHFAKNGFDGANTAAIAKDASVSVGTVFRIFPKKEDIANEIFQRFCAAQEKINILSGILPPFTAGARESFDAIIKASIIQIRNHPHEYIFFESSFGAHYLDQVSKHMGERIRNEFTSWISFQTQQGNLAPADVSVLFALSIGGLSRLARESILRNVVISDEIEQDFLKHCWQAIAKS